MKPSPFFCALSALGVPVDQMSLSATDSLTGKAVNLFCCSVGQVQGNSILTKKGDSQPPHFVLNCPFCLPLSQDLATVENTSLSQLSELL